MLHPILTMYEFDAAGRRRMAAHHVATLDALVGIATALETATAPTRVVCLGCGCLCLPTEKCPGCRARREQRSHP